MGFCDQNGTRLCGPHDGEEVRTVHQLAVVEPEAQAVVSVQVAEEPVVLAVQVQVVRV